MSGRALGLAPRIVMLACSLALATPATAAAALSTRDITPFPPSKAIVSAWWTSNRYDPPSNQWGDILPTIWADDGSQYTMMDDGGTDASSGALWRQSLARIDGNPPNLRFSHVGNPNNPPPQTYSQIAQNENLWLGPLGPYYSSGLVEVNHVFFATQQYDWDWTDNGMFAGLAGIAYSLDRGRDWLAVNKHFPAPLGNLSWVIHGQGGVYGDGWVYAIGTEREFNAGAIILGRSRPDVADITDPARWQWFSGFSGGHAKFSSSFAKATSIVSWNHHITYPQIAYDAPIHRYLLTFTFSYENEMPAMWRDGMDLVILEAQHPWGPYSFVAHEPYFGPSNGYSAGIPVKWISSDGRDLWMKWAANFDGCAPNLDCSGGYGFNYRSLHLKLAGGR